MQKNYLINYLDEGGHVQMSGAWDTRHQVFNFLEKNKNKIKSFRVMTRAENFGAFVVEVARGRFIDKNLFINIKKEF